MAAGRAPRACLLRIERELRVSEVWESREQQEQFAQHLMPVMEEENVNLSAILKSLRSRIFDARGEQRIGDRTTLNLRELKAR